MSRLTYLARVARVYIDKSSGPLSFWYEAPTLNERAFDDGRSYFMQFQGKSKYKGPFDAAGVPLLDYRGDIGRQYNPIAIAQYGLARFNRWVETSSPADEQAWRMIADWLAANLRENGKGVRVWMHDFNWPYRTMLRAPWYSGLAQGNGLSLLVRAAAQTGNPRYSSAAHEAFQTFRLDVTEGGVMVTDERGDTWIEEYLVIPPSHILNGFIWASWGVHDYARWTGDDEAWGIWNDCLDTLERRLDEFDTGWWSLYEHRLNGREMLASRYYHQLHITQLDVMYRLTTRPLFHATARRFERYRDTPVYRWRAFVGKAIFKLRRY